MNELALFAGAGGGILGGKLYVNPDFWESLLEWPIGWTGAAPLETGSILEWQQQHGSF